MSQRQPRRHNESHLDFIRELPCVVCGNNIETQAAHVRFADSRAAKRKTGIGERPDDKFTVPLCGGCHALQHEMNEQQWWKQIGLDPVFVALALYSVSGDHQQGSQIVNACRERLR